VLLAWSTPTSIDDAATDPSLVLSSRLLQSCCRCIDRLNSPTNSVYFEANLVNDQHYYPYGYSDILPIRFDD